MAAQEEIESTKPIITKVEGITGLGDITGTTDKSEASAGCMENNIGGASLKELLYGVSHMKHSTIRIHGTKTVYFDPFKVEDEPKDADMIFISHSHYDHFSANDIKKLAKDGTVIVIPGDCAGEAVKAGLTNIVKVAPNKNYEIDGLKFSTVAAYNINKQYHKKESNWVGYILYINKATYYFAGDTDFIPEMKDINADVVFLPVGGTYTMTWTEAVQAANLIKPILAIPIHFGDVVGTSEDAGNFIKGLNQPITGVVLKK